MSLVKKIQNTISEQELFPRGSRIVIGVSGGPDSVCLLNLLWKLKKKYELELIVAHANYGLRGKDSDSDEELVRRLAAEYGLELFLSKPRVRQKSDLENHLRNIRYDFFEQVRRDNRSDFIAVAHNLDDQAETFLMRIIRGAGLQGLSAMRYKNGKIVRPLLNITRKEILEYLKDNKLKYRIDKTNLKNDFLRNKIRNRLIPELEKNYNPRIKKTLFDSTVSITEDQDWLSETVRREYRKMKVLSARKILAMHPALQRRFLLEAIQTRRGDLKDIDAAHIEELLKAIRSTKNKSQIVVFKRLKMVRNGDKITINNI